MHEFEPASEVYVRSEVDNWIATGVHFAEGEEVTVARIKVEGDGGIWGEECVRRRPKLDTVNGTVGKAQISDGEGVVLNDDVPIVAGDETDMVAVREIDVGVDYARHLFSEEVGQLERVRFRCRRSDDFGDAYSGRGDCFECIGQHEHSPC